MGGLEQGQPGMLGVPTRGQMQRDLSAAVAGETPRHVDQMRSIDVAEILAEHESGPVGANQGGKRRADIAA
ncbi:MULTISPECIES: hypothetical protein [unclassified Frankia]|uniref:hypothetical protein n=1 Tax=unclassified Frankia TaxID=2632575 RepID=UPI002AD2CC45|nr:MULTISPECIES: hypothetical protein [unclassified Frankia]